MNFYLVEDDCLINQTEIEELIPKIPFYWKYYSTTEKFPIYAHVLISRPLNDDLYNENFNYKITSEYYEYFKKIVDTFCEKHNIKYKNIIRACINSTFHIPNYEYGDPHIDFTKDHIVLIMYLSKVSTKSKTIIFNMKQDYLSGSESFFDVSRDDFYFMIKHEITPKFGKIVAFDGVYYHSNRIPNPGENRIVCVFNLLR